MIPSLLAGSIDHNVLLKEIQSKLAVIEDYRALDKELSPYANLASAILYVVRKIGFGGLSQCKQAILKNEIMPILRHFYEPLFDERDLKHSLSDERPVVDRINWNVPEQLEFISRLHFNEELINLGIDATFEFKNGTFDHTNADFWYNFLRSIKPSRVIEIGSGVSTNLALRAINKNKDENPSCCCKYTCIDPYSSRESYVDCEIIKTPIELTDVSFFTDLNENDILFVDSSHMIRPQGDVLFIFHELLPILRPGVIVHFHDIFTPRDYPPTWVTGDVRFWNEQYLLETLLIYSKEWSIVAALQYLYDHHHERLSAVCPHLMDSSSTSIYIKKH